MMTACVLQIKSVVAGLCLLMVAVFSHADQTEAEFEKDLDAGLAQACDNGALPETLADDWSWLDEHIYQDSMLCSELKSNEASASDLLVRYRQMSSQSSPQGDPYIDIDIECEMEYMCREQRIKARRAGQEVTQETYSEVARVCDERYPCIEAAFQDWPASSPLTPSAKPRSIQLAGSAKDKTVASRSDAAPSFGFGDLLGAKPVEGDASDGVRVSLDGVFAQREQHELGNLNEQIDYQNLQLKSLCECSLSSGCYDNEFGSVQDQIQSLSQTRGQTCAVWRDRLASLDANNKNSGQMLLDQLASLQAQIKQMDTAADQTIGEARKAHNRMVAAQRAQQREQEKASGFQWGKFAALTAGALAGGALDLDSEMQADVLLSIAKDSMGDSQGMGNLQSTLGAATSAMGNPLGSAAAGGSDDPMANYAREMIAINKGANAIVEAITGQSSPMHAGGGMDVNSAPSSGGGNVASSGGSKTFSIDERYKFTCPSGTQGNIPIKSNIPACAQAMRRYAYAASCNMVNDMESTRRQYEKLCASEIFKQ